MIRRALAFAICAALAAAIWVSANDTYTLFLRQDPGVLVVAIVCLAMGASLGIQRSGDDLPLALVLTWIAFFSLSIFWSAAPAASVRASLWSILYMSSFVAGLRFPSTFIAVFLLLNVALLGVGVDMLLVTGDTFLTGVWFNKNVQGAQFLLFVPILAGLASRGARWSPYLAFLTGGCVYYAFLTRSMAGQILLVIGVVAAVVLTRRQRPGRLTLRSGAYAVGLFLVGAGLAFSTVRPEAMQLFGVGVTVPGSVTAAAEAPDLSKHGTRWSLSHRVEMIEYGLREGVRAFPLGTGVGSTKELYPAIKRQPGIDVADLHNYYVQLFMTTGPVGLLLFISIVALALWRAVRRRAWLVGVSIFLFAGYLAFDVPAYYPPMMMMFFGLMGTVSGDVGPHRHSPRLTGIGIAIVAIAVATPVAWAYWMRPCSTPECAIERRLASEDVIRRVMGNLGPSERVDLARRTVEANPRSLWAYELLAFVLHEADRPVEELSVRRTIALEFQGVTDRPVREWLDLAEALQRPDDVARAHALLSSRFDRTSTGPRQLDGAAN